jgi:hypothetical protein
VVTVVVPLVVCVVPGVEEAVDVRLVVADVEVTEVEAVVLGEDVSVLMAEVVPLVEIELVAVEVALETTVVVADDACVEVPVEVCVVI